MSNYWTKSDVKEVTGVDTLDFAKKVDLASLKLDIGELDTDKLEVFLTDLSKLKIIVDKDVIKKTLCDESTKKVNVVDSHKKNHEKKIGDVDKKIPYTSKCIETQEFNRLIITHFNARIIKTMKNLTTKKQVETAVDLGNKNIEKTKKLQTFDLSSFIDKTYSDNYGSQNYLIFQIVFNYF